MGCGCGGGAQAGQIAAAMPTAPGWPAPTDPILWTARTNSGEVQTGFDSVDAASTWVAARGGGTVHAQAA